jgi:predicted metal-dependent HD superfamily phosphohydrolase
MKSANKALLCSQWEELMAFYGVEPVEAGDLFADLVTHYEENGRYYHTLGHIQNVLETIESLSPHAEDYQAIQLAAWFHDVIYDVHRSDNETQSAIYAGLALRELGIPAEIIAKVGYMIRATQHNRACPMDIDCQIMLDADLATFASNWEIQEEIERAIRQEYAFVPEEAYRQGRQLILQNFLKRERIYCTELMFAEREEAARQNIAHTIETLRAE